MNNMVPPLALLLLLLGCGGESDDSFDGAHPVVDKTAVGDINTLTLLDFGDVKIPIEVDDAVFEDCQLHDIFDAAKGYCVQHWVDGTYVEDVDGPP